MTTTRLLAGCIAIAVILLSGCAGAQAGGPLPELQAGMRIRVETAGLPKNVTGSFLFVRDDSVAILVSRDSLRIASQNILRIQESRGRSRARGATRGALIGLLAGVGGLGGMGLIGDAGGAGEGQTVSGAVVGVVFGAVIGPPIGAVVGAFVGSERWSTLWQR